ncbi:MAG: methionyl-tRNA formyltransferase, partial [Thermacetogeniaceae bacterium]
MKILFCGTAHFALPALKKILDKWEVLGIITQPDRPRGRGRKIAAPPVKEFALASSVPVYQPKNAGELIQVIEQEKFKPDLLVVVAYGLILPARVLDLPLLGCINLHPSLLPAYRGAAPIQRAIMNGEQITGVTTMYLSQEMDAGDIIYQEKREIPRDFTAGELAHVLAEQGARLLVKTISDLEQGKAPRQAQDPNKVSYAPPLSKEDERIHWNRDAEVIYNQIRGMNPKPGAYTEFKGRILKVWRSQLVDEEKTGFMPGDVVKTDVKRGFVVQTGSGQLLLTEVQP